MRRSIPLGLFLVLVAAALGDHYFRDEFYYYGDAGAIERLGKSRGLVALSGHNNYWIWGPRGYTGNVMIVLTRSRASLEQRYASVEQVGETDCGDCMPYENRVPIFLCRGLKQPLAELWPALKHYD